LRCGMICFCFCLLPLRETYTVPSCTFPQCSGDHRALHSFPTRRSSDLMENTNLSKQQQVSEIMRQMLTQAQTAGQYLAHNLGNLDRKSGSAGMPRPISYAVFS